MEHIPYNGYRAKIAIIIVLALLILQGCAVLSFFVAATQNPVVQTTVKYGIVKYLTNNPEKKSEADRIVSELIATVDRGAVTTLYELEGKVLEAVPWHKLDNADQYILLGMISTISEMIQKQVSDGVLSPKDKLTVKSYLEWIQQAIRFSGM